MTAQEILNYVVNFMRVQGEPSIRPHMFEAPEISTCAYYQDGGARKCAVGCLIHPDHYSSSFEGSGLYPFPMKSNPLIALRRSGVDCYEQITPEHRMMHLLEDLQMCHDLPANSGLRGDPWLREFEKSARITASKYGLEYPAEVSR